MKKLLEISLILCLFIGLSACADKHKFNYDDAVKIDYGKYENCHGKIVRVHQGDFVNKYLVSARCDQNIYLREYFWEDQLIKE